MDSTQPHSVQNTHGKLRIITLASVGKQNILKLKKYQVLRNPTKFLVISGQELD